MDQPPDKPKPVRDTRHYLGSVTILINNTLFKIPKQYFAEGLSVFGDILPLPLNDPGADEASDDNPIYLDNISIKDFERLLEVMFPTHRPVIVSLEEMDPMDKVWLGKIFRTPDWLLDGYHNLVERKAAISEDEGEKLGLNTAIRLFHIREAAAAAKIEAATAAAARAMKPRGGPARGVRSKSTQPEKIRAAISRELLDVAGAQTPTWANGGQSHRISAGSELVHHGRFYMENIIFLVEDALFKVPRASFERSELFTSIFSLPAVENTVLDGSDDEHPFKLDGICKSDFQAFLGVLYPCQVSPQAGGTNQTIITWISTLKLSTMWDFFEVRNLAIQALSTMEMDPVFQVANALQYKVPKWLFAGLESLVKRKEAISISEAKTLGLETTIRIYQIREDVLANYYEHNIETVRLSLDSAEAIRREFAEEIREVEQVVESRPEG